MSTTNKDFKCIKDYIMEDGEICFTKGNMYEFDCYMDKSGINDQGDHHILSNKEDFEEHFIEIGKREVSE